MLMLYPLTRNSILLSLCVFLLLPACCFKGSQAMAQDYKNQRLEFAAYNVGFHALVGGIGAAINKKPEQSLGNAFLKGAGKGALGGLLIDQAKNSVYQVNWQGSYHMVWPVRLTNALGSSIVQNAAANRAMLDRLHLNLWLFRADYTFKERQFLFRAVPTQVYAAFYISRYGSLNFGKSLKTGLFFYDIPSDQLNNSRSYGHALATSIAVGSPYFGDFTYNEVLAHEVMHNLQYENAVWLNPYFDRVDKALKDRYGLYKTLSRFIYLDANVLAGTPARLIGAGGDCHFSRFSEKEAQHYATRQFISCEEKDGGYFPIQ